LQISLPHEANEAARAAGVLDLFEDQLALIKATIAKQMAIIEEAYAPGAANTVTLTPIDTALPLAAPLTLNETLAETLLWLLAAKDDDAARAYNIPVIMALAGPLDTNRLSAAVETLFARHEAMRAVYPLPNEIEFRPMGDIDSALAVIDAREWSDEEQKAWAAGLADHIFDPTQDTLFRFTVVQTGAADWLEG